MDKDLMYVLERTESANSGIDFPSKWVFTRKFASSVPEDKLFPKTERGHVVIRRYLANYGTSEVRGTKVKTWCYSTSSISVFGKYVAVMVRYRIPTNNRAKERVFVFSKNPSGRIVKVSPKSHEFRSTVMAYATILRLEGR